MTARDEELAEAFAEIEGLAQRAAHYADDLQDKTRGTFNRASLEQTAQDLKDVGRAVAEMAKWIEQTMEMAAEEKTG